jgi:hypothetical protein
MRRGSQPPNRSHTAEEAGPVRETGIRYPEIQE